MMEIEHLPATNKDVSSQDSSVHSTKAVDLVDSIRGTKPVVPRGYSISQSATSANAIKELEEGTSRENKISSAWKAVSMGGTVFDGFLLAASQEVGQSILTLPNVFSQTGFAGGVLLELTFATLALYTNYLLVCMHAQHRHNLKESGDKKHTDPYHIVSYHEIMDSLVGKWMKLFSVTVVFFALLGLSTVQIIATASNCYILSDSISKRTWALIWGGMFSLIAFVPTFRHYRILSVLGILTTTYTAWFMTITSAIEGPQDYVVYDAPQNVEGFFNGFVQLLFIYGGHTSNIEVADVMDNPASYGELSKGK
jgi:auxin influx carrier (AUX1 LAX family)